MVRSRLLVGLALAALGAPAISAAAPAAAPVEPVTDDYYGTKVTDPYRWMESGKDPEWMPWLMGQADHSRAVFDTIPGRARLLADIGARSGALPSVSLASTGGPYLFVQ